jgi:hypothetical protein
MSNAAERKLKEPTRKSEAGYTLLQVWIRKDNTKRVRKYLERIKALYKEPKAKAKSKCR